MSLTKSCSSPDLIMKSVSLDNLRLHRNSCKDSTKSDNGEAIESFELREDPNFWKEHNVQVIIRIRPLSSHEISSQGHGKCIRQDTPQNISWIGHPESRFTFDLVADENVSQETMFKVAGVPLVDNCMAGYNSCMFAYGQTGSGKTHTMLGDIERGGSRHSVNCGMTPRVFDYLFSRIQKIREDSKKGIHVENITEAEVTSARDVIQQLIQGAGNRKVAATNMNQASSRSHSVFTCIVESKWESMGVTHHRFARLNLVDLAGSERQKSTGAEGERLKEATNINKSLSTLGLVIMNLVNVSNGKSLHVPYRDSKLTFLLQDSLGGNAKTIIIANISPSSCCSLETLSTLKFAQRAKFIKNHAIVNEDASENVLALRLENQNLKKEITRLSALVDGGAERHDTLASTFPGSPASIAWAGQLEFSSPLLSAKKLPRKKDNDAALVGAIRMANDKDMALQALAAENKAAMHLAKEKEDEVQCLKMMLKFREAAIRRLEAVVSKQMPVETHLVTERNEHSKEIEILRSQVERNQHATRFATENLKLKEEIRRLKSFCEDGERERMDEQIVVLQNKLLDALDWKLMHESDLSAKSHDHRVDDFLNSNKESDLPWQSMLNEENEFLKLQAIQYQSEINSLREKLELYIEEKENLQRCVTDLEKELEEEKLSKMNMADEAKKEIDALMHTLNTEQSNQTEIEAMVDAIAAASQREAEAHETAILLSKENDELRMKLNDLIQENNKVVELYQNLVTETQRNSCNGSAAPQGDVNEVPCQVSVENLELEKEIEMLKSQLAEMQEENEKLFGLYENAMQEKDEMIRESSLKQCQIALEEDHESLLDEAGLYDVQLKDESSHCSESDEVDNVEEHVLPTHEILLDEACLYDIEVKNDSSQSPDSDEVTIHLRVEDCFYDVQDQDGCSQFDYPDSYEPIEVESELMENTSGMDLCVSSKLDIPTDNFNFSAGNSPSGGIFDRQEGLLHLCTTRKQLADAEGKLVDSAEIVSMLSSLEKAIAEDDGITERIAQAENIILVKKNKCEQLKVVFSELLERKDRANKKLSAVKHSMASLSSSLCYFEKREALTMSKLYLSTLHLKQDKDHLASLHSSRQELVDALSEIRDREAKVEEENQKVESERVLLFTIDSNIEKPASDVLKRTWQVHSKATALLEAEVEKVKLQKQIKQQKEQRVALKKEAEVKTSELYKIEKEMQLLEVKMQKEASCAEEFNSKLQSILHEKTMLLETQEDGKLELENLILDYHQCCFEADMKSEEIRMMQEELVMESRELEDLKKSKDEAAARKAKLLEALRVPQDLSTRGVD